MTSYYIIKYFHLVFVIILASTLIMENILIKRNLPQKELTKLAFIDMAYGISAGLVITAGLLLWFATGKPAIFYSHNWIFHSKLTLFLILAILSIIPTVFFVKNRKGSDDHEHKEIPGRVIVVLRIELILLFIIPLFAVLMANGVGSF